jgi:Lrp/AsnC family leucine-responsive transcriptional regulator
MQWQEIGKIVHLTGQAVAARIRRMQDLEITEAYRISGEGCYWLKACVADQKELTSLLDSLLVHGNYRVNLSLDKLK